MFEDDRPIKKTVHEIGSDVSLISIDELKARITLLREEISRLETEIGAKTSSRGAAESLFKSK